MSTELEFFLPVYDFGQGEHCEGARFGTTIYSDLQELYAYEPEAVGHTVAKVTLKQRPLSGAV